MKGLLLSILALLILSNMGCQKPKHKPTDLNGTWERIQSNDGRYIGMQVLFNDDAGTIASLPTGPTGYFSVGAVKWQTITPVVSAFHEYEFQELSSNNTYLNGTIDLYDNNDTLKISSSFSAAPGSEQIWVRR